MPYLIDGHNLIPKLGLHLDSPDDEMDLVGLLQEFARLSRHNVDVYFDGAPTGHAGTRQFGRVTAHFVRKGTTADSAIKAQLGRLGQTARNWNVVSSDHEVQNAGHAAKAKVISSEEFTSTLRKTYQTASKSSEEKTLSPEEVDEWLKLFRRKR